jgi:hypothetical protein
MVHLDGTFYAFVEGNRLSGSPDGDRCLSTHRFAGPRPVESNDHRSIFIDSQTGTTLT